MYPLGLEFKYLMSFLPYDNIDRSFFPFLLFLIAVFFANIMRLFSIHVRDANYPRFIYSAKWHHTRIHWPFENASNKSFTVVPYLAAFTFKRFIEALRILMFTSSACFDLTIPS